MKIYSVLIVDDHPLICESYQDAFKKVSSLDKNIDFKFEVVHDSDSAIEKIDEYSKNKNLDIIMLDINIPPSKDGKVLSGEDLGLKVKQALPNAKIMIATMYNDNFRLNSILKNIDPEGFIVKNDINSEELVVAIQKVIDKPPYYSPSVLNLMRSQIANDYILDKTDRKLLYELSIGSKMKDLPNVLFLSIAGVERRKRRLKDIFGVKNQSDRELLLIAKEKGFI